MIKIIFFDAAGTLFHLPRGVGWHYCNVAERLGCSIDAEILRRAFLSEWRKMPIRPTVRIPRPDDDKGWWRELVNRVLDQCRVPLGQLDRGTYFEKLYEEFALPGVWESFPEVHEVLTALRSRYRLGVISNFDGRLRAVLGHLDLADYFDPVIISSEVGADKPDAWIFQQAVQLAGVTPSEVLHVGDDPVCDRQGAVTAGLSVFRLHRPDTSLRNLLAALTSPSAF